MTGYWPVPATGRVLPSAAKRSRLGAPCRSIDACPVVAEQLRDLYLGPSALAQAPYHVRELIDRLEALGVQDVVSRANHVWRKAITRPRSRFREILTLDEIRSNTHVIHANQPSKVIKMIQIGPEWSLRCDLRRLSIRGVSHQIIVQAEDANNATWPRLHYKRDR